MGTMRAKGWLLEMVQSLEECRKGIVRIVQTQAVRERMRRGLLLGTYTDRRELLTGTQERWERVTMGMIHPLSKRKASCPCPLARVVS